MEGTIIVAILIAIILFWRFVSKARSGAAGALGTADCYSLLRNGVAARGILLKVGTQRSARGTASPGYYEVRPVTIDVEIAGDPSYECDCSLYVPANLRRLILPGATLELRVDPSSKQNIAVYGPGVGLSSAGYT